MVSVTPRTFRRPETEQERRHSAYATSVLQARWPSLPDCQPICWYRGRFLPWLLSQVAGIALSTLPRGGAVQRGIIKVADDA